MGGEGVRRAVLGMEESGSSLSASASERERLREVVERLVRRMGRAGRRSQGWFEEEGWIEEIMLLLLLLFVVVCCCCCCEAVGGNDVGVRDWLQLQSNVVMIKLVL